jgi:hypothetical protein
MVPEERVSVWQLTFPYISRARSFPGAVIIVETIIAHYMMTHGSISAPRFGRCRCALMCHEELRARRFNAGWAMG